MIARFGTAHPTHSLDADYGRRARRNRCLRDKSSPPRRQEPGAQPEGEQERSTSRHGEGRVGVVGTEAASQRAHEGATNMPRVRNRTEVRDRRSLGAAGGLASELYPFARVECPVLPEKLNRRTWNPARAIRKVRRPLQALGRVRRSAAHEQRLAFAVRRQLPTPPRALAAELECRTPSARVRAGLRAAPRA